jgi:hypothetical protein
MDGDVVGVTLQSNVATAVSEQYGNAAERSNGVCAHGGGAAMEESDFTQGNHHAFGTNTESDFFLTQFLVEGGFEFSPERLKVAPLSTYPRL